MNAHEYADKVSAMPMAEPCKYGHIGCATHEGGPCCDEVLTQHEHEEPDCSECGR